MKSNVRTLTHDEVGGLADSLAHAFREICPDYEDRTPAIRLYPVPRGGVPVAYLLLGRLANVEITDNPALADYFVDDIIDSGATMERYLDEYLGAGFLPLIDKRSDPEFQKSFVVFPWERGAEENGIEDNIRRILQFIGEDPGREGLLETPARFVKAMRHWFSGYTKDPAAELKVFQDGADGCDEMVVVRDIPFFSHCEHHIAPIFGTVDVAYIPNGRIIGLSKMARVVEIFARRLQVQERLTNQIAEALMKHLEPMGVGVVVKARHFCMESRGIEKMGSETVTSSLRGVFKDQPSTRSEFLMLTHR